MNISINQKRAFTAVFVAATEATFAVLLSNCGQSDSSLSCPDARIAISVVSGVNALLLALYGGYEYKRKNNGNLEMLYG